MMANGFALDLGWTAISESHAFDLRWRSLLEVELDGRSGRGELRVFVPLEQFGRAQRTIGRR